MRLAPAATPAVWIDPVWGRSGGTPKQQIPEGTQIWPSLTPTWSKQTQWWSIATWNFVEPNPLAEPIPNMVSVDLNVVQPNDSCRARP